MRPTYEHWQCETTSEEAKTLFLCCPVPCTSSHIPLCNAFINSDGNFVVVLVQRYRIRLALLLCHGYQKYSTWKQNKSACTNSRWHQWHFSVIIILWKIALLCPVALSFHFFKTNKIFLLKKKKEWVANCLWNFISLTLSCNRSTDSNMQGVLCQAHTLYSISVSSGHLI